MVGNGLSEENVTAVTSESIGNITEASNSLDVTDMSEAVVDWCLVAQGIALSMGQGISNLFCFGSSANCEFYG